MNEIDLDLTVSKNTANTLEKVVLEYKERILRDLAENINIPYKTLKTEFLERDTNFKNKYYGPDRTGIDPRKCMARVWHSKLGGVQCSRSSFIDKTPGESIKYEYCKTHLQESKRNYGRIDEDCRSE